MKAVILDCTLFEQILSHLSGPYLPRGRHKFGDLPERMENLDISGNALSGSLDLDNCFHVNLLTL